MIVELQKILLYGSKKEMDHFFALAQRAGFMEFIGLSHKKSLELTEELKTVLSAIQIAKKHEVHPKVAPFTPLSPGEIAEKIVHLQASYETLLEERRVLTLEIARIAPFGDFAKEDLTYIEQEGNRVVQFFCRKLGAQHNGTLPPEVIYLNTEYDLDYFMSISKERLQIPKMIEVFIDHPLGELTKKKELVEEKIAFLEKEIRTLSNYLPVLQSAFNHLLNDYELQLTKRDAASLLDDSLFAIEAWVPINRINKLQEIIRDLDLCMEEIAIEPQDKIPTCMENKGVSKMGEDLVHIYDIPAHTDKDPSIWVFVFFAIFFAMIVSDAGYGVLYLAIAILCKWKFPALKTSQKRALRLAMIISTCCIIWGIASASFFGIEIGPDNPYRKVSFMHFLATKKAEYHMAKKDDVYQELTKEYPDTLDAIDGHDFLVKGAVTGGGKTKYPILERFYDNIFLELSLLVGVIHISLAFCRYLLRNFAGLGWIVFMIGGYLYFPKMLNATSLLNFTGLISKETAYVWGFQMIWVGMAMAFIGAFLQKKWGALHEMMNVIQIFGDVLSYIRIYALALAGMMVASTFNGMGQSVGLVGGILIIIAGHMVNVLLSIMGGMIHGLRLNFLEWYHYCFEGGGRLFNPLRLRK